MPLFSPACLPRLLIHLGNMLYSYCTIACHILHTWRRDSVVVKEGEEGRWKEDIILGILSGMMCLWVLGCRRRRRMGKDETAAAGMNNCYYSLIHACHMPVQAGSLSLWNVCGCRKEEGGRRPELCCIYSNSQGGSFCLICSCQCQPRAPTCHAPLPHICPPSRQGRKEEQANKARQPRRRDILTACTPCPCRPRFPLYT